MKARAAVFDCENTVPTVHNEMPHRADDISSFRPAIGARPLRARMSRSSPGRYAVHEFAKNVFSIEAYDGTGKRLTYTRPNVDGWDVAGHDGTVRLVYRIFGDYADGTYMAVDTTHAHLNMPAAFLWAAGLDARPIRITFVPPAGSNWKAGTQLFPTSEPFTFTAPNLQYFLDSPTELSDFVLSTFTVPNADGTPSTFRLIVHSDGAQEEVDDLARMVQRLVREQMAVFGEFPKFEPGHYTFLLDYVRWGAGDGMEHRNSTSISNPGITLRTAAGRRQALGTISHEFFHAWNVERIRPVGLEPFDFTRENITCCLWVAEGFTQYYGALLMARAGLTTRDDALRSVGGLINAVNASAGRRVRFAPEMSRLAPFVDAACSVDPTNWGNTYLSYYTFGAAIALGLDLELRDRTDGRIALDDYMKALWTRYGKTPSAPGTVATPYTAADLQTTLAEVSGSGSFAREFFERYVDGPELVEYGMLLKRMGLIWKPLNPGRAWMGELPMTSGTDGARITNAAPMGTPAYDAGFGEGDVLVSIGGKDVRSASDVAAIVEAAKPGDRLGAAYLRHGKPRQATIALRGHPTRTLVTRESAGETPTPEELKMREAWLGSRAK
jgi:predicted metalloprotease with PDZ domain